jgi:hypothetical protein
MTIDEFWNIVDRVHAASNGDKSAKQELLREELRKLSPDAVGSFYVHFHNCMVKAYDWNLWAAAYIIGEGCGDDSFSDFRAWLISMGRNTFENIIAAPELLIEIDQNPGDFFNEGYQYIPWQVYEEMTGEMPVGGDPYPDSPSGDQWEEDDLPNLYPALDKKFNDIWTKYFSDQ